MKSTVSKVVQKRIRELFKELIKRYKENKYSEEIIKTKNKKNNVPVFQLRFFKRGEKSIYYRILLNENEVQK